MFSPMEFEEQEFRIKPMNCPFHIGIYKSAQHSYRDLPLRYAEFGTCYRAELSGALHGLMRVRGFTQDDAHIFCTPETVRGEIVSCIDFAFNVYEAFGFKDYKVELSVRGDDRSRLLRCGRRLGKRRSCSGRCFEQPRDSVRAN